MKDYNSSVNQEIKRKFVEREVKACFSYEMDAILRASDGIHAHDLPTIDDVDNLLQYTCHECGHKETFVDKFEDGKDFRCPSCNRISYDEPESEHQDILEWWIVTEYLYDKLKEKGEPVLEWGNNYYWGRTCSGQAILLDGVISSICSDMEILEGQKNDWSK